jgi:hypothetical protein
MVATPQGYGPDLRLVVILLAGPEVILRSDAPERGTQHEASGRCGRGASCMTALALTDPGDH